MLIESYMIVKIFKPVAEFKAVFYNLNKVLKGGGEVMKISGFGLLKGFDEVRIEDYRNYLEAQTALNSNIRLPQFHAMISAPDSSYDKQKLTKITIQWLEAMGYGDQPYLLVLHKDTDQAHIHIVSTRIDRKGEKIKDSFEHKRAIAELNRLMQLDEKHQAQLDAGKALRYHCSTKAQVLLLLEGMGYRCLEKDGRLVLCKFGKPLFAITDERMLQQLAGWAPDKARAVQLKAIIRKYQAIHDSTLKPETTPLAGGRTTTKTGYRTDLSDYLRKELGLQFIFHASGDKEPYGYTIIDHVQKRVFKGSEVMKLAEFIEPKAIAIEPERPAVQAADAGNERPAEHYAPPLQPYFTNDIDDQQIHGPRRRRQKKARTNTR